MDINNIRLDTKCYHEYMRQSRDKRKDYLLAKYRSHGKTRLHHEGLPEVAVNIRSMGHSDNSRITPEKIMVLCDRNRLDAIFKAGTSRQEPVVFVDKNAIRKGKYAIDNNKLDWAECWHVTGRAGINGRSLRYDFTVVKLISNGKYVVYDLTMRE